MITLDQVVALAEGLKKPIVENYQPDPQLDLDTGWNKALDALQRAAVLAWG